MQPPPALIQHPRFAQVLAALGAPADQVETGQGPVILTRRRIGPVQLVAALRAPLLDCADLRRLRARGLGLCEPDGAADLRGAGFRQVMTPVHVAELDLRGNAAERRARLRGKWRNRLVRAEAGGLRLRDMPFSGQAADWLVVREAELRAERRYRAMPTAISRIWAELAPGAARLFLAERHGEPLAAMLFLIHGRAATYQLGWSGAAGRAAGAHHLILNRAAAWLADRGIERLDLGAVDTEASEGLARFKIGSGAALRPLGGSWIAIPFL